MHSSVLASVVVLLLLLVVVVVLVLLGVLISFPCWLKGKNGNYTGSQI